MNNITIEALSSKEDADKITLEEMDLELKRMGLVAEDVKIVSSLKQSTHDTFPVLTVEFQNSSKKVMIN